MQSIVYSEEATLGHEKVSSHMLSLAITCLDKIASVRYRVFMPNVIQAVNQMRERLETMQKIAKSSQAQLDELAAQYEHIRELESLRDAAQVRTLRLAILLSDEKSRKAITEMDGRAKERAEVSENPRIFPLWEFIQEYLSTVQRAKVSEIVEFMRAAGFENVERQTVESAIKSHPETFTITKHGYWKWVSIRQERKEDAPATKGKRK